MVTNKVRKIDIDSSYIGNPIQSSKLNYLSKMDLPLNSLNTTAIGILSVIIIIFCLSLFRPSKLVGQGREPPSVAGAWPIVGHLPLLSKTQTPHKTLGSLAEKYGPIFSIKIGAKRALVINNWEIAKECFTTIDLAVSSRPKLVAIENMSYNQAMFGFAPYGPYWRELRKIVTLEFLSNRRIELLSHVRVSEVQASIRDLYSCWSSRDNEYELVEMREWFSKLTFNMVLRMLAGKRFFGAMDKANEEKANMCLKTTKEYMRLLGMFHVADAVPSLRWFDFGGHEKVMKQTAKEVDNILSEWLEEHRQNEKAESDHRDFMDVMISVLSDTNIEGLDGDTVNKATTLALILGGTDTTTVTLVWALCLLLRNPLVLEKAKEELDTQIGNERMISEEDISKLVYLQAIVKETLRLYPASPLSAPREFTEDCTLGGYHIRKGTRLITNLWKIHTDPNIWEEALEFKPERFLTTHKMIDVRGQNFEFLPFGSGRRICPGISFALHMVHFTLASFLHSFEILNSSMEPVDISEAFGLTNSKATPLEIHVKPRLSPGCYEIM